MSIKIGTKIEKLHPDDPYKLMDWDNIEDTHNIKDDVANLKSGQAILENNINQKPDGMHLEDTDGNAYDDITGIVFDGAEVQDDQGTKTCHVVVKPKITVANGQAPDSTSETGNALIFNGASISTDVNDPNVIYVNIGGDTTTFKLSDGVGVAKDIHEMRLEGADIRSSDGIANIHIPFKHFKTIAERDAWKTTYQSIIKHDVIGVVDADDNGFVGWYRYDAATHTWKDYNAQGMIISDLSGAIPKNIKTIIFGNGFDVQQAGDQEDAALVTYSGGGGGSPLTVAKQWGDYATVTAVDDISLLYPLEVIQGRSGPNTPTPGAAVMSINPQAYEPQHGNSCLVKLDMVTSVAGQHPHTIYMPEEVVPTGEYFHLNTQAKGIDVQDSTGGDTSVTGGQMTEALVKLSFQDIAPEDGTVTAWLEYKDPSNPIDKKILTDVNGHPMAVSKHIGSGESIGDFIIAGAFMAKATQPLKVVVETSFNVNSKVALDPVNTMLCLNQFSNGYETSVARIEFLHRAGLQITPAIQKFDNKMLALSKELRLVNQVLTIIGVGDGGDTLNEFGVQNLTPVGVKIENDTFTVKDTGAIADFYVDTLIDNTHTRMLRGKQIASAITISNPDTAFEYEAYKWTGKPDHVTQVYSARNNGSIVINDGWSVIKGVFIAEQASGNSYGHTLTFDVPEDANNILILVRPQVSQSPLTLELSEFDWGATTNFTGYVEIERYNSHEQHLRFDETYAEYLLNSEGYQSLRYTINNTPPTGNPMPVGKLGKGKAPVTIDHTVNQVSGSQVPQFDGAIKFTKDGEASISKSYNVWNEQGTDNTVTFWDVLIDVDGNETKIPESEKTFTVPKNTGAPGTVYTIPAYAVDVEAGQRIGGRASTNKPDGAYVQTQNASEFLVQTVVDFKELISTVSDNTDLVNAPLDKKLIVDRRVYPFTGNSQQNITITGLDIPADVHLASVTAEKTLPTGSTSIEAVQHAYNRNTQTLTVHVGSTTTDGVLYLEFWA